MSYFHAIVWIDHEQAHVIHFNTTETEEFLISSTLRRRHANHASHEGHVTLDQHYFKSVEAALTGAGEILVVGPANAKNELMHHMRICAKALAEKVVGVEVADHPTDPQLVAMARRYFKAKDRMIA